MGELLGDHGNIIVYGIIGVMFVVLVCVICNSKWKKITPEYKNKTNNNNSEFVSKSKNKFPIIEADEIIYIQYQMKNFDCIDFIKATDNSGKDITKQVKIYGNVDTEKRGVYKVRCVVTDDNQLTSTKYINIIVE